MTLSEGIHRWMLAGASVRGVSHLKHGVVCQDAHATRLTGDTLIIGVCDGAGSASMSHLGSRAASEAAVETIVRELCTAPPGTDQAWRQLLELARTEALAAVELQADAAGVNVRDLATTLLLAVATPKATAVLQIGDGAVVAEDSSQCMIVALTRPEIGEYANETVFLTTHNVEPQISIGPPVRAIAAFSDGLQRLALQLPGGIPHEPFFRPLFRFLDHFVNGDPSEEITEFLMNSRVTSRSDDDITLVVATRRN